MAVENGDRPCTLGSEREVLSEWKLLGCLCMRGGKCEDDGQLGRHLAGDLALPIFLMSPLQRGPKWTDKQRPVTPGKTSWQTSDYLVATLRDDFSPSL